MQRSCHSRISVAVPRHATKRLIFMTVSALYACTLAVPFKYDQRSPRVYYGNHFGKLTNCSY